ncbi:MAG TPA: D-alanine--D-alanine ligase family protein [Anaerolineales bacterium]|nr:D-alanine--D-alanine ligase family protein [Anaerolineales bacterium]
MSKLRLGILFGGRSGEHEVSLLSARSILDAVNLDKYLVTQIGITHDGEWLVGEDVLDAFEGNRLESLQPATLLPDPTRSGVFTLQGNHSQEVLAPLQDIDVFFPVLHGTFGEDGTIQGLFEMAGIAYVGAGVLGSALGMDKGIFKDVMRSHSIPVVESFVTTRQEIENDLEKVVLRASELAPYPLFVKPANLGSSVGITKCFSASDLVEGLIEAARFDRRVLVERGVDAREIEISVLGNDSPQASVPGEILPSREFYSYEAKYLDNTSGLIIPAPISEELTAQVQDYAVRAYQAIDCSGMARVDFLLEKDDLTSGHKGKLYLNEVNTIPGFTQISMYPKLWQASGLPYSELIDRLIDLALERKIDRDRTERRYRRES